MATIESIGEALKQVDEKKEKLRLAFLELQAQSSSLSSFTLSWADIDAHFSALHATAIHKFNLLKSQSSNPQTQIESAPSVDPRPVIESAPLVDPMPMIESAPSVDPRIEPAPSIGNEEGKELATAEARPELKSFCEGMDGVGLRNYIVDQKPKARLVIGDELRDAFKYSPNAGAMVLDALEGYFVPNLKGNKDTKLMYLRKACITMLEAMMESKVEVSPEVRERAKSLALDWKEKVSVDESSTFEPYGFLFLVANYGLVDVFSMDDLIDMSVVVAIKFVQSVRLFHRLCFGDKMSDLIKKIISKEKQLQAVKYILEFKLADKFPPVPLLKEYVEVAKKNAEKTRMDGKNSLQSLNEATTKEVNALTYVINVINDFKLEAGPLKQSLTKRIEVLEKEKASRKKHPLPSSGPKFRPQNLTGVKRLRDITHAQIPNNVAFVNSANNPSIHQAVAPHVAVPNPTVTPFQQSYSAAPSFANTQPYAYNVSSSAQAYGQSYSQFAPGADVATTASPNVPSYQHSYVQHTPGVQATTPNVGIANEAVSAYQQSYLQPRGSLPDHHAAQHRLAGNPAIASYASSSAGGLFGSAEASLGTAGNSTHAQAHVYATEPNTASGYYDRSVNYGGYAMPQQYQPSYRPQ